MTENKTQKVIFMIFSLLCFIAIATTLICDLALNKGLTWFYYPLVSVVFGWFAFSPLILAKKNRIMCSMLSFSVFTFPFLFFLQNITPVRGWFAPLGMPVAIAGLIAIWAGYILLVHTKINKWYVFSFLTLLCGVGVNMVIRYCLRQFDGGGMFTLDTIINTFASVTIAVLLVIIGYTRSPKKKDLAIAKVPRIEHNLPNEVETETEKEAE